MGTCTSTLDLQKDPLFKNTESIKYRIPALIYIDDTQTFLAFAEKRTSPADVDATFLVMRTGTQQNGSIQWENIRELTEASLERYRTMNPCPVYNKNSKTVFLFFNCVAGKVTERDQIYTRNNRAKLCYVTSEDSGKTWSEIRDLTETVAGLKDEIKNWATFSVGPGHGIQMKKGKLIIPAYVYYNHGCCVKPNAFAFYSDDAGANWKFGQRLSVKSTECAMAEIIDTDGKSRIYCNARNPGCCNSYCCSTRNCCRGSYCCSTTSCCSSGGCCTSNRVESWSNNDGMNFNKVLYSEKLVESRQYSGCQGSVVSFTRGDKGTWLLFSHPTDSYKRTDLGIYLNKCPLNTNHCGWNKPSIINPGLSGYSDLAHCGGERFACLMECGEVSKDGNIAFVEFSLNDIMKKQ